MCQTAEDLWDAHQVQYGILVSRLNFFEVNNELNACADAVWNLAQQLHVQHTRWPLNSGHR